MANQQAFVDITTVELGGLLSRVESAAQDGAQVLSEDLTLLLQMAKTYAYLREKLESEEISNYRLLKLLGLVRKSEKSAKSAFDESAEADAEEIIMQALENSELPDTNEALKNDGDGASGKKGKDKNRSKHGKRNKDCFKDADQRKYSLADVASGSVCKDCRQGKMYKFEPSVFVRIRGEVPLQASVNIREQMRCNCCLKVVKAELPHELIEDGADKQRFGYSAVAIVALLKYAAAFPWHRLADLQAMLGTPVSASTLWDLMEGLSNCVQSVDSELKKLAACAKYFYLDDTSHRIINIDPVMKKRRNSTKEQLRSGIHTSGLIAIDDDGRKIIIFKTGIQHAGEHFDEILNMRPDEAGTFVYMSDALSSNKPTVRKGEQSLCNAHCRREFDEIKDKYPEEVERVLECYRQVYKVEKDCKRDLLSPQQRLQKHKEVSLPLMTDLILWSQRQINDRLVEPNSALGKAYNYLINHQVGLLAFTRIEGAGLDNNLMENALRIIVLGRKNYLHFKEQIGAKVADIITSVCATAEASGANCFDYLVSLQRYAENVKASPDQFLPWNYQKTIERLLKNRENNSVA